MKYTYLPHGVCAQKIEIELTNNIVESVKFTKGCSGNLKAISQLVKGKKIEELEELLSGITCGVKQTSCSDQLVKGLKEAYTNLYENDLNK